MVLYDSLFLFPLQPNFLDNDNCISIIRNHIHHSQFETNDLKRIIAYPSVLI